MQCKLLSTNNLRFIYLLQMIFNLSLVVVHYLGGHFEFIGLPLGIHLTSLDSNLDHIWLVFTLPVRDLGDNITFLAIPSFYYLPPAEGRGREIIKRLPSVRPFVTFLHKP